jgi:molecular chaperone GrpE (heat shock protein)
MAFTRSEIREILGEAHTDEIAQKLITLHRSVVDPIKDDLDSAKRDATKWKTEADKLPDLQKQLEEAKKGEDWKAKYEKEKSDFDAYKTKITQDAETAKVKAAYKKLLTEEKISEKSLDAVLNVTDYSKMKLKEDGTLDGVEDLKKDIADKWGGFKVTARQRGEKVDNPPTGAPGGSDSNVREYVRKLHEARYGAPQQN